MSTQARYPRESGYLYSQNPTSPWLIRLPLLAITGLVLLFFILLAALAGYQYSYQNKIYPGVSTVYGVNLAGMTRQEAVTTLDSRFTYDENATFVFHYNGNSWEFTAAELGVRFDAEATANAAYNMGRGRGMLRNLWDQFSAWKNGVPVEPVILYDQSLAEQALGRLARDYVNQPVIDATVKIENQQAVTTPSQVGRVVDVPATLELLQTEIMTLSERSEFNLVVREHSPAIWSTDEIAHRINLALDPRGVTFFAPPETGISIGPWTATPESIENMLRIVRVEDGENAAHYELEVTGHQVQAFLERIAPDLQQQPVNARFIFNDDTRQLEVIQPSQDGRALDIATTMPRFEEAVFSESDRSVPLAFNTVRPPVHDQMTAAELGITELVQSATTYYVGSTASRRTNIQVAAAQFHGVVIPPHSEFSFNEWLGDVSLESGFEEALIIYGDQTITGVGGGVCQVSTTVFQAAFYAGFPIIERYPHAYRVGYYEAGEGPGMDATVYEPIVDFRFLNDTDYHLLIETYVQPGSSSATFRFYSTDTGRTVIKEGPYVRNVRPAPPPNYIATPGVQPGQTIQIDYAVSGADVYVYRTVRDADGNVLIDREEFASHYVPWPAQYQVAPGDSRANR